MKKISLFLSIFALLNFIGYGFELKPPKIYKIRTFYNYGKIDGFVQIPKGGKNGTTSVERPTLNELGIDNIGFTELKLQFQWDKLLTYGEIKYKIFDGDSTLQKDLISHNKFIPVYSKINTEHEYIGYNIGIGYDISKFNKLKFIPIIEFSMNNFKYKYSATTPKNQNLSSKRSFGWGQLNVGFNSSYEFTDKYSLELNTRYGIKHDSIRKYYDIELINNYEIYKNLHLLMGVEYENLKYRDTQSEKQNFMKHKNLLYKIGLEYIF